MKTFDVIVIIWLILFLILIKDGRFSKYIQNKFNIDYNHLGLYINIIQFILCVVYLIINNY